MDDKVDFSLSSTEIARFNHEMRFVEDQHNSFERNEKLSLLLLSEEQVSTPKKFPKTGRDHDSYNSLVDWEDEENKINRSGRTRSVRRKREKRK